MKPSENDIAFVRYIVEFDDNVEKSRVYIKENFGIDSTYDKDNMTLHLVANNVDVAMNILAAREYLFDNMPGLRIVMGL